jgi:hypothetical protein
MQEYIHTHVYEHPKKSMQDQSWIFTQKINYSCDVYVTEWRVIILFYSPTLYPFPN